jgi:hypothetical protein
MRAMVASLAETAAALHAWQAHAVVKAAALLGSESEGDKVPGWIGLPPDVFGHRMSRVIGRKTISQRQSAAILEFHRCARQEQVELLRQQLALERKLAVLVEDAYGLTEEERCLLRETRPVRDPIDVLEAKIAGRATDAADPRAAQEWSLSLAPRGESRVSPCEACRCPRPSSQAGTPRPDKSRQHACISRTLT